MSFKYGFFNALDENRLYQSEDYASVLDGIIDEGFFSNYYNNIEKKSYSPIIIPFNPKGSSSTENSMQVMVQPFRAWLHHTWNYNDINQIYEIEKSSVLNGRIDVFVVKVDTKLRKNSIEYIKGTPNPVKDLAPPDITNDKDGNGIYYFPIAYIYLPRRTYNITTSNIISVVDVDSPSITVGTRVISLENTKAAEAPVDDNNSFLNSSSYIQDILDRFEDFKTDNAEAFKEWFAGIKDIFSNYTQKDIQEYEDFEKRITELESRQGNIIIKLTFSTSMIGSTVTFHNTDTTKYKSEDKTFTITDTEQNFYLEHIGTYLITENKTGKQLTLAIPYFGEYEGAFASPVYIVKDSVFQITDFSETYFASVCKVISGGYICVPISSPLQYIYPKLNANKIYLTTNASQLKTKISTSLKFVLPSGNYKRAIVKGKSAIKISSSICSYSKYAGVSINSKDILVYTDTGNTEAIDKVISSNIDKEITFDTEVTDSLLITWKMGTYQDSDYITMYAGSYIQFEELALYE